MKGKWAKGIVPRNFCWVIKDQLAVCERLGGYAANHRRVRRQEEIIWVRESGFARIVSLLPSNHNLHHYDDLGMAWEHIPFIPHTDPRPAMDELFAKLAVWLPAGDKILVHQEELGDTVQGLMAAYLIRSGLVTDGPQAITVVERLLQRQMGTPGRELANMALEGLA